MDRLLKYLIRKVLTFALSIRYQVEIRGLDKIKGNGYLFLPNHVSILDATIFQVFTWTRLQARPFATTRFTTIRFLRPLFNLLRTIPVPDYTVGKNSFKLQALEKAFEELLSAVKKGDNVLFYPAGRLKTCGLEKLGGVSGLYDLLQRDPSLKLVLVRTTGLWGSQFSPAPHQATPDLIEEVLKGFKFGLRSFFRVPKRKVLFEFETFKPPHPLPSKLEFNRQLEAWYNAPYEAEGEPVVPSFVPKPFFPNIPEGEMTDLEKEIIEEIEKIDGRRIKRDTHLFDELGLDSLDTSELFHVLEEKYGLTYLYTSELITPFHIALQIEKKWRSERVRLLKEKERKNLSFLKGGEFAAYDEFLGLMTPKEIWRRVEAGRRTLLSDVRSTIPFFFPPSLDKAIAAISTALAGKKALFLTADQAKSEAGIIYSSHVVLEEWHGWDIGSSTSYLKELFDKGGKFKGKIPELRLQEPDIAAIVNGLISGTPVIAGRPLWIKNLSHEI